MAPGNGYTGPTLRGSVIKVSKHRSSRRALGATLVLTGALLMWLAPGPTFSSPSGAGPLLLLGGIILELVGIALERREDTKSKRPPLEP